VQRRAVRERVPARRRDSEADEGGCWRPNVIATVDTVAKGLVQADALRPELLMVASGSFSRPSEAAALNAAITELVEAGAGANEKKMKWLYDILTILDNKTAHLLRLNALLLAANTFLLKMAFDLVELSWGQMAAMLSSLIVPLLGIFRSLSIFQVEWRFLPWKDPRPGESQSLDGELEKLAAACQARTASHHVVWRVTAASVVAFIGVLAATVLLSWRGPG
jgi:hypothetical protein